MDGRSEDELRAGSTLPVQDNSEAPHFIPAWFQSCHGGG
jgi:hypothetical protein